MKKIILFFIFICLMGCTVSHRENDYNGTYRCLESYDDNTKNDYRYSIIKLMDDQYERFDYFYNVKDEKLELQVTKKNEIIKMGEESYQLFTEPEEGRFDGTSGPFPYFFKYKNDTLYVFSLRNTYPIVEGEYLFLDGIWFLEQIPTGEKLDEFDETSKEIYKCSLEKEGE